MCSSGNGPRVEVTSPRSLPKTRRISARKGTNPARKALARVPMLAPGQVPEEWGKLEADAHQFLAHRVGELGTGLGFVSTAVAAITRDAAEATADAAWLRRQAMEKNDPELLKLAHTLKQHARQHHLAAWELAVREAAAHGAVDTSNQRAALADALDDGPDPLKEPKEPKAPSYRTNGR